MPYLCHTQPPRDRLRSMGSSDPACLPRAALPGGAGDATTSSSSYLPHLSHASLPCLHGTSSLWWESSHLTPSPGLELKLQMPSSCPPAVVDHRHQSHQCEGSSQILPLTWIGSAHRSNNHKLWFLWTQLFGLSDLRARERSLVASTWEMRSVWRWARMDLPWTHCSLGRSELSLCSGSLRFFLSL